MVVVAALRVHSKGRTVNRVPQAKSGAGRERDLLQAPFVSSTEPGRQTCSGVVTGAPDFLILGVFCVWGAFLSRVVVFATTVVMHVLWRNLLPHYLIR